MGHSVEQVVYYHQKDDSKEKDKSRRLLDHVEHVALNLQTEVLDIKRSFMRKLEAIETVTHISSEPYEVDKLTVETSDNIGAFIYFLDVNGNQVDPKTFE